MLIDRPSFPPSATTFSPHLSMTSISSTKESPWRVLTLATHCARDSIAEERENEQNLSRDIMDVRDMQLEFIPDPDLLHQPKERKPTHFEDLPAEIHQGILDMLVGNLNSTSSSPLEGHQSMRNWSNAMRHPRRRQLSDLALVSQTWRRMVQERLFRHGKIV